MIGGSQRVDLDLGYCSGRYRRYLSLDFEGCKLICSLLVGLKSTKGTFWHNSSKIVDLTLKSHDLQFHLLVHSACERKCFHSFWHLDLNQRSWLPVYFRPVWMRYSFTDKNWFETISSYGDLKSSDGLGHSHGWLSLESWTSETWYYWLPSIPPCRRGSWDSIYSSWMRAPSMDSIEKPSSFSHQHAF